MRMEVRGQSFREDFLRKKERLERKVTNLAQKLGIACNEVVAAQVKL